MDQVSCEPKKFRDNLYTDYQIVRHIRRQKHDFSNHLQVISGYIQLKKYDKAADYIKDINKSMNILSNIFKLDNPTLSLLLYEYVQNAYKYGIEIDFEVDTEKLSNNLFAKRYDEKINLLNKLFDVVLRFTLNKKNNKVIYIDIFDENNVLYIVFSNCYSNGNDEIWSCGEIMDHDLKEFIESFKEYGVRVYYKIEDNDLTIKIAFDCRCV